MKILSVRRGRSPNCSATGSVVGLALLSVAAAAVVVNAFADRFTDSDNDGSEPGSGPDRESDPTDDVLRKEDFGGILAVQDPPAMLYLDDVATAVAEAKGARLVGGAASVKGALSAPTEVHLAVSETCNARCDGCYLDTSPGAIRTEPPRWRQNLEDLAAMGVFEVALGGGESLHNPVLFEIAHYARTLGMTPNLTTSGLGLTEARARALASVMGQVNVSLDGLGQTYTDVRGWSGDKLGIGAIERLVAAGARVGVNTVICRQNVQALEVLAEALSTLGVVEWQWLRFKPSGRGEATYASHTLSEAEQMGLWPRALALQERTGLTIRFDCAMIPFLVAHEPPLAALEKLGISGCPGGESLWIVNAKGQWLPCSFAEKLSAPANGEVSALWRTDVTLEAWRARAASPPEPCASCEYQAICRGGCRVVSAFETGDAMAPDPACPRVRAL